MSPRIFISYSRANADIVDRVKNALTRAGADVWLDHERLTPGTPSWQDAIRDGITQATHVVYIASETAARSDNVFDEISIAKSKGKTIIPFWVRGSDWHDCVPIGFGAIQHIDGRGASFGVGLAKLLTTLGLTLPKLPAPPQPAPSPQLVRPAPVVASVPKPQPLPPISTPSLASQVSQQVEISPVIDAPKLSRRGLLIGAGALAVSAAGIGGIAWFVRDKNLANGPGTLRWSFQTGGWVESSPAVANGVVYVGSVDGNLYALDATTGVKRWSYQTGRAVDSSPAVANGLVYVGSDDGYVYALNA